MKRFVFAVLMAVMTVMAMPAGAQKVSNEYRAAETVYDSLPPEIRVEIQVLITAYGGWSYQYPNDEFSPELFKAIKTLQVNNGLKADGQITKALMERLYVAGRPYLSRWSFVEARLPERPTTIWVPTGFGLKPEVTPTRIRLSDPQGQLDIYINSFPKGSLKLAYDSAMQSLKQSKVKPKFARRNNISGLILYDNGNYSGYLHYQTDKYGVIASHIRWNNRNSELAADRMFHIMIGSIVAAVDRTSFPPPYSFETASSDSNSKAPGKNTPGNDAAAAQKSEPRTASSGTGFFVNSAGHLLTNAHVVGECRNFAVTPSGGEAAAAKLVAVDAANDLALLKVNAKPSAIAAIRSSIKLGEPVAVFGYPLSSVLSRNGNFTLGNVTALAGMGDDSNQLQISAPVQPGNSGGPLIDHNGNLVGVIVSKLDAVKVAEAVGDVPQNVNFAIKASVAVNFLSSNGIGYSEAQPGAAALDPVALAEKAKSISAFILCK